MQRKRILQFPAANRTWSGLESCTKSLTCLMMLSVSAAEPWKVRPGVNWVQEIGDLPVTYREGSEFRRDNKHHADCVLLNVQCFQHIVQVVCVLG